MSQQNNHDDKLVDYFHLVRFHVATKYVFF